jgi:hypothetical protein
MVKMVSEREPPLAHIGDEQRGIGSEARALDRSSSISRARSGTDSKELKANMFPSTRAAARDAIKNSNPKSIQGNREYGLSNAKLKQVYIVDDLSGATATDPDPLQMFRPYKPMETNRSAKAREGMTRHRL